MATNNQDEDKVQAEVEMHMGKFTKLADFCKENGIAKFAYGDIEGGGYSQVGKEVVERLRNICDVDYSGYNIYYVGSNIDEEKSAREQKEIGEIYGLIGDICDLSDQLRTL